MNKKTGLIVNLIGAICALICLLLNVQYNLVVRAGLPVEAGIFLLLWELVHIGFFNYFLYRSIYNETM